MYKSNFFKADRRKELTFCSGSSFGSIGSELVTIEDIFLSPETEFSVAPVSDELNILLPIIGKLSLVDSGREISPENLLCYCDNEVKELTVRNPFIDEMVNFLHVRVSKCGHACKPFGTSFSTLTIDRKNELVRANGAANCLRVGVYDSRVKDKGYLTEHFNGLSTYIINGSFDFEERLMEHRDNLYQWDIHEVEFEALSEMAIILLIECSPLK